MGLRNCGVGVRFPSQRPLLIDVGTTVAMLQLMGPTGEGGMAVWGGRG